MRLPTASLLFVAAATYASSPSPTTTTHVPACTATSSTGSGAFFDLRPDMAVLPPTGSHKSSGVHKDYFSKGYDYGRNFTINVCGAVVDPVSDVVGVGAGGWANISAYYSSHGNIYSIGSQSMDLQSRGRKLVLQYTGGSPCGAPNKVKRAAQPGFVYDDEDSALVHEVVDEGDINTRRKSTIISFLCDRDPTTTQAAISFVGTDPDECAYFFEARSIHACAHAEPHKPGSVGPGSVFGLILIITVMVYILGGVFYNRTVAHARGWRQLPNFSLWAGIWSFICDMFIIAWSSCARRIPGRGGYEHLNTSSPARREQNAEAENRLIDQLDEEWDD
ncbi:hypothetical protein G7046_g105 [Stylonectria norvegica]|nr:hypothetical protein G7046_g105 [Stylonectria norvegica]